MRAVVLTAACSVAASCLLPPALPAQATMSPAEFATRRAQHWAWQPLADPPVPAVADAAFVQDPLDAFVLARLEAAGLRPAPPAPPHVWLRRVWFDLAGLPPPPDAVRAFVADPSRAARERVVDALLASPQHAERWARHWLDLVRYAESLGHEYDFPIPNAWRYRDYVIRAIERDVPFDEFGREHVAGDLLDPPREDPATGANESVQATAFWWFAEQTHSPVDARQHRADRIDNQIDVLSKAFLGVTVACARCHDHKFDAITSADYYALYGFLKSSRYVQQPLHRTPAAAVAAVERAHRDLAALAAGDAGRDAAAADAAAPRDGDVPFADLAAGPALPAGWFRTGDAFGSGPWRGPFVTGRDDDAVLLRELPGPFRLSAALGRDREGTLHSPQFTIERPFVHLEVAGADARAMVVVDGLHLVRDPIYGGLHHEIANADPHWLTFDVTMWQGKEAHLQLVDQRAHDLADPERNGGSYDDGWFAVRRVVFATDRQPPPAPPAGRALRLPLDGGAAAAAWRTFERARTLLPDPATLPAMADGTGQDEHVFVRGSHAQPGVPSPRRFLAALDGDEPLALPAGSGRLQLARRMFAPSNPLPARVLVNRVWHHLFGQGFVRSVDNLGHLGELPTHPELLDRLARDTMQDGWSQRRLLRRIVLSSTYAMQSSGDAAAEARDPTNALLHRQRLRRLEGEALRDALLAVAGRLDDRRYGPSVPVSLHAQPRARGRPRSGPIDGDGRRSIYLAVQRNFLPDLLCAFDLPTPFTTIGARSVSNVPAQALTMLNDPFVHAMCRLLGDHVAAEGGRDDAARLERLWVALFARGPDADERRLCLRFLAAQRDATAATGVAATCDASEPDDACGAADANDPADPCDATDAPEPWAELAHALVVKKEFLYLQ